MQIKLLRVGLLLSFLGLYLEWGKRQHAFVAQIEWQIISLQKPLLGTFLYPLVLLPFVGQLLLLYTLFTTQPRRWQTRTSIVFMGTLAIIVLLSGVFSFNWKIILSSLPFWTLSVLLWRKEK